MAIAEGLLVRTRDGTEGYILAVEVVSYAVDHPGSLTPLRTVGYVGLLQQLDMTLTSVPLEGAAIIGMSPILELRRPEPTTPTSQGEPARGR